MKVTSNARRLLPTGSYAVLVVLGLIAACLFVLTTVAAGAYHRMQLSMARDWYQRGQAELQAGHSNKAIEDFRNALAYSRDRDYLLRLAQSLAQAGEYREARGYLLNLWDEQPGRAVLNLELARLSARTGQAQDAVRYYQNAIYGVWDNDPAGQRRAVRFELARYLLARGDESGAEADLIALAPELPTDPAAHSQTGELFLQAGDPNRSLQEFEQALKLDRNLKPALIGAGMSAFSLANYKVAERYLERAVRQDPADAQASNTLKTARLVLSMDPFERRLSSAERMQRLSQAWQQTITRVGDCAAQNNVGLPPPSVKAQLPSGTGAPAGALATPERNLVEAYAALAALKPQLRESARRDGDTVDTVMLAVERAQQAAATVCGTPTGADLALVLIGREHRVTQ